MAGPQQTPGRRNKACSLSFCCVTERGTRSRPYSAQTGNIHACPASRGPEEPPAQRARRSRRAYHPRSEKRRADRPNGEQRTSDTTYDRSPAATRDKEKYGGAGGRAPLLCACPISAVDARKAPSSPNGHGPVGRLSVAPAREAQLFRSEARKGVFVIFPPSLPSPARFYQEKREECGANRPSRHTANLLYLVK